RQAAEYRQPDRDRGLRRPPAELAAEPLPVRAGLAGGACRLTSAASTQSLGPVRRRRRRLGWLNSRSLARALTAATPAAYVAVVLIVPIVLIGLYSFGLMTNVVGVHTAFSTADWSDFLTGA